MPSAVYKSLFAAILRKRPVRFIGNGRYREACPHVLGWAEGLETVFVFQTGGGSESGPLPDWRCFRVAEIEDDLEATDGRWRTGSSHKQRHSCVKEVDIDINPHAEQRHRRPKTAARPRKPKANTSKKPRRPARKKRKARRTQKSARKRKSPA